MLLLLRGELFAAGAKELPLEFLDLLALLFDGLSLFLQRFILRRDDLLLRGLGLLQFEQALDPFLRAAPDLGQQFYTALHNAWYCALWSVLVQILL